MKKVLIIALAVIMACVSVVAFADDTTTVKISKFYQGTDAVPAYGTAPSADPYWAWADKGTGYGGDTLTYADGVATWTTGGGYINFATAGADATGANTWQDLNTYTYLAFQVENTSDTAAMIGLVPDVISSGYKRSGEIMVVNPRLYDANGEEATYCDFAVKDLWSNGETRGYVTIPSGKTVWIVIPFTGVNVPNFASQSADGGLKLRDDIYESWTTGDGCVTFVEGSTTPLHFGGMSLTLSAVEGSTDSADVSVIAYAVAAITGLGALVVAKKR